MLKGKAKNPTLVAKFKILLFFTMCGETLRFGVVIER
jgi:hypothetical protein